MADVFLSKNDLQPRKRSASHWFTFCSYGLALEGDYGDVGFVVPLASELDGAVNECVEGVVLAHADVGGGVVDGSSLADYDVAGLNDLAAEFLETQALALTLTTVL